MIRYKGICIFGSMRSGSTFLCEQLAHALRVKHGIEATNLYEFLSPMQTIYGGHRYDIDHRNISQRPSHSGLMVDRLENLEVLLARGAWPILKIFPEDYTEHTRQHIRRVILADRAIFKICLNRRDVANQILSYFIAQASGIWHRTSVSQKNHAVEKIKVKTRQLHIVGNSILAHYAWHAENADACCDRIIWHHQLSDIVFPELDLDAASLCYNGISPNSWDHATKIKTLVRNHRDVMRFANDLENDLQPLIGALS